MTEELKGLDRLQEIFKMEAFDKKLKKSNTRPPTDEEVAVFIDKHMLPRGPREKSSEAGGCSSVRRVVHLSFPG